MQFLQRDLATATKPGENELRTYYSAHPELFTTSMSVTFEQLYFSADHGGWKRAQLRARRALDQEGMVYVLVNGRFVVDHDKLVRDTFPGRPIYSGSAAR